MTRAKQVDESFAANRFGANRRGFFECVDLGIADAIDDAGGLLQVGKCWVQWNG